MRKQLEKRLNGKSSGKAEPTETFVEIATGRDDNSRALIWKGNSFDEILQSRFVSVYVFVTLFHWDAGKI